MHVGELEAHRLKHVTGEQSRLAFLHFDLAIVWRKASHHHLVLDPVPRVHRTKLTINNFANMVLAVTEPACTGPSRCHQRLGFSNNGRAAPIGNTDPSRPTKASGTGPPPCCLYGNAWLRHGIHDRT